MRISKVAIKNFKGLRDLTLPGSQFVCVIGENNAGKSSIMQALMRHIDGKKLEENQFYALDEPIEIRLSFEDIDEADLLKVGEAHRAKLTELVRDGRLTTVRRFRAGKESELKVIASEPADESLRREALEALVKGKRAPALHEAVYEKFPSMRGQLAADLKKDGCVDAMVEHVTKLDSVRFVESEVMPTGIDAGVKSIFPQPIYVPAVRDLGDEMKAKDGASFGKLLALVLEQLREDATLAMFDELFVRLDAKLNVGDQRLSQLRQVESRIDALLKEQFARAQISLRFDMPDLKTLLSSAIIDVDDGMKGEASTKGDGIRRALTFALIRALVEAQLFKSAKDNPLRGRYLFLFEEPELFLHPSAQKTLFGALKVLSDTQQVFVTTHSPLFFEANSTTTFVKLSKRGKAAERPFAESKHIDLRDLGQRLSMQTVCFENNAIAFFARAAILIEGISDHLVLPHLARLVCDRSGFELPGLAVCRVDGKTSFRRYRDFFNSFSVGTLVVADLDCILDGFEKLGASTKAIEARERFIVALDKLGDPDADIKGEKFKELSRKAGWKEKWDALRAAYEAMKRGEATPDQLDSCGNAFFAAEQDLRRRTLLGNPDVGLLKLKRELLALLRDDGIFLLEKGAIEQYYPEGIAGADKVSKAMAFCDAVKTREQALDLCDVVPTPAGDRHEFVVVFETLLEQASRCLG